MKLIIDISEEKYNEYKRIGDSRDILFEAIRNGTPLNEVLDKIRAEIEENAYPIVHGVNNHEKGMTLYGILQIIDKHRDEVDCRECKAEYECYYCKKYAESENKE